MKLIPIFMLVLIGGVCAKGFSQKQQLNLKLHQCSVSTLFKEIRKQTGLKFVYNEAYMKDLGKLDVNCSNRCVKDVLDEVFAPAGLECHFEHDVIFITRRTVGRLTDKAIRNKVVKGKVFDTNGETLPGATVILQGTSSGTVTDKDGNFQLPVPAGAVLKISCIGKKTKLVKITDPDRFYTVTLENDQVKMDEVVVTGYQVINPHEHVGVTTKVKAEDLEIGNATKSIEQMLEGKVAGMHIANPSGVIGQKQRVKVRGTSSILGNQEPVWVVDGIIQEDPLPFKTADFNAIADGMNEGTDLVKDFVGNAISWLSPNDIQDITVLKDVAATVLYGVKAANGVIVIQTKRGKEGRTTISYNGGVTMNFKPRYSDLYMMDSEERVDVSLELINSGRVTRTVVNPFGVEYFYQQYLKKEISYEEYRAKVEEMRHQNTDWFNVLLRDPVSQTHSLNISGGSSMINYYTSLNYNSNKGQSRQNSSEGYSANLNLNGWIFKNKLRFNAAMRGNITHTKGLNGQNPFSYAKRITRTLPAFTEDGKPYFYLDRGFRYNQDFENSQRANLNSQYALNGTLGLEWTILKGLRMNATAGFNFSHVTGRAFSSELSNYISRMCGYEFGTRIMSDLEYKISELPHGGDLKTVNSRNANWTARGQMDYVKTFNGRHRFSLTLGSEFRSSKREGYDRQTYGYMHDKGRTITAPPILILDENTEEQKANPLYKRMTEKITDQLTNMVSFYGNVSYAYNEKASLHQGGGETLERVEDHHSPARHP